MFNRSKSTPTSNLSKMFNIGYTNSCGSTLQQFFANNMPPKPKVGQVHNKNNNTMPSKNNSNSTNGNNSVKYLVIKGKKERLNTTKQLGKGGEGTVYLMTNLKSEYVAKIYHKITPNLENKINYMINNKPDKLFGATFIICWPEYVIVDDKGNFIGYAMRKGFDNSIELYELTKPKLKNNNFYKFGPKHNQNLVNKLKLLINICVPLNHITDSQKYVMVDFKPQNILTDVNGRISILDTDSFQISENNKILYNARVATPEYTPKEYANVTPSKIKYNEATDMFAIAVSFYQILMGIHPYVVRPKNSKLTTIAEYIYADLFAFGNNQKDIISKPPPHNAYNKLPADIQNLFVKTFTTIHRPKVSDWGQTIADCINNWVKIGDKQITSSVNQISKNIKSTYTPPHTPQVSKMTAYVQTLELLQSNPKNVELSVLRTAIQTVKKLGDVAKDAMYKGHNLDEKAFVKMSMALRCAMNITYIYSTATTKNCMDADNLKELISYLTCINKIFLDNLSVSINTSHLNELYRMKCSSIEGSDIIFALNCASTAAKQIINIEKLNELYCRNYHNFKVYSNDDLAPLRDYKNKDVNIANLISNLIGVLNAIYMAKYRIIDTEDTSYV